MPVVKLGAMPSIKISFEIDQDQLADAIRVMRPYSRGAATIEDMGEVGFDNDAPVISARKARDVFLGKPTPPRVKKRKVARRLKLRPPPPKAKKPKGQGANGAKAPVQSAIVECVREAGPDGLAPTALHDAMVRKGFGLQSSYNGLFVAKKAKLVKLQGDKIVIP